MSQAGHAVYDLIMGCFILGVIIVAPFVPRRFWRELLVIGQAMLSIMIGAGWDAYLYLCKHWPFRT